MKIHFIGIGGAGMSAIAELMLSKEAAVSGSDIAESPKIASLRALGAEIIIGHSADNISNDVSIVVYTSAVRRSNNPELVEAARRGIRAVRRAEFLSECISEQKTIAVAGTHGKTTTTAMIAAVLLEAKLDPTIVAGGSLPLLGGRNSRAGAGEYAIVEADEFDRSFLALKPWIAVITSLEAEHLDIYKDLADLEQTFADFANISSGQTGEHAILCSDDPNVRTLETNLLKPLIRYGLDSADALYSARNLRSAKGRVTSEIFRGEEWLGELDLGAPGDHNQRNALAAIAVGDCLGIPFEAIAAGLRKFKGVDRRFTIHQAQTGHIIVDDYAHHPTEIRAAISAARQQYPDARITACFQPHTFTRTRDFMAEFAESLTAADAIYLLDIYPAREKRIEGVTSLGIAEKIPKEKSAKLVALEQLPGMLFAQIERSIISANDVILFLGAGSVPEASAKLLAMLNSKGMAEPSEPQTAGSNPNVVV